MKKLKIEFIVQNAMAGEIEVEDAVMELPEEEKNNFIKQELINHLASNGAAVSNVVINSITQNESSRNIDGEGKE